MKALITGISGFVGSHLAEELLRRDLEVHGTVRDAGALGAARHLDGKVTFHPCNLLQADSVEVLVAKLRPDQVYHLAAQSFVPASWSNPLDTIHNNTAAQLSLLEALRRHQPGCRVHIACSSEEYGQVGPLELPVREEQALRPVSPYAISKITQDYMGYQYYAAYGMPIVRTRAFNHTGPRHGEHFVISNFAKQIAEVEAGRKPPVLYVGNLESSRDFTDVRDVVRAYVLALEQGIPGECYNVASGQGVPIGKALELLLTLASVPIGVVQDPSRLRPTDVSAIVGDYAKLHTATGWKPEIPFTDTLRDVLQDWRGRVRGGERG